MTAHSDPPTHRELAELSVRLLFAYRTAGPPTSAYRPPAPPAASFQCKLFSVGGAAPRRGAAAGGRTHLPIAPPACSHRRRGHTSTWPAQLARRAAFRHRPTILPTRGPSTTCPHVLPLRIIINVLEGYYYSTVYPRALDRSHDFGAI